MQVTSTTFSAEGPALRVDCAHATNELGQIVRNAPDSPGSSSVATLPGSQVCTDHGRG